MLHLQIDEYPNHKIIYYGNIDQNLIRTTIVDLEHNIIQDVICEYDKTGRHICDVLFGQDPTEILAYREYHFRDNEQHASGWTDYKKVNGKFVKLHSKKSYWIMQDELSRCDWFYPNGELAFYDLFKFDDNIGEMCKEHSYFANGKVILDYANKPKLERFDDYYLDFV